MPCVTCEEMKSDGIKRKLLLLPRRLLLLLLVIGFARTATVVSCNMQQFPMTSVTTATRRRKRLTRRENGPPDEQQQSRGERQFPITQPKAKNHLSRLGHTTMNRDAPSSPFFAGYLSARYRRQGPRLLVPLARRIMSACPHPATAYSSTFPR